MSDPVPGSAAGDDTTTGSGSGSPPSTPRWVKVLGIVVVALVLLVLIVKLTGLGGSDHGPGRHTGGGDTAPPSIPEPHSRPGADHG